MAPGREMRLSGMPMNGHALGCLGSSLLVLLELRMLHPPSSGQQTGRYMGDSTLPIRVPAHGSGKTGSVD